LRNIAVCLALAACAAFGQPTFDVASVKPAAPTTGHFQYHMTMRADAGRAEFLNASFVDLIHTAYRVSSYQVAGPEWLATEKFDVVAKLPEGASKDQVPEMLQTLLAARFKLSVHHSTKERPGYVLVVGKSGPKVKESPAGADGSGWSRTMGPEGAMHMETRKLTMTDLAQLIGSFMDYPVQDMTELKGYYDVPLDFSAEDLKTGAKSAGVALAPDTPAEPGGSSIAGSLQRVGLRLEPRKLVLDLIVVEHVERTPTQN